MTPRRIHFFLLGLAAWLVCLTDSAGAGPVQETLHCLLVEAPYRNLFLIREEMKIADPPALAKDAPLFSTTGGRRDVLYRGSVSLSGQDKVELGSRPKEQSPAGKDAHGPGITIKMEKLAGKGLPCQRYEVDLLAKFGDGSFVRCATAGQTLAVTANTWQEVASWIHGDRCLTLWQFVEAHGEPEEVRRRAVDDEDAYRVDVVFACLREETLAAIGSLGAARRQNLVEETLQRAHHWKCFALNCRPGQELAGRSASGSQAKLKEEGYGDSQMARILGTLERGEEGLVLDCALQPPQGGAKEAAPPLAFGGKVTAGEWKFQELREGPGMWKMPWLYPPRGLKEGKELPRVNVVAWRVWKDG